MKKIKSVIKTLLLLFIAAFSFSYINVYAAAPKTIQTASSFDRVPGYIDGVEFNIKKTTAGKYLYCMDIHKSAPKNMTLTLAGVQDAGMTYIMVNGYPNKSITGNSKYDYYITQTAVWWYLDLTTGSSNLSSAFKNGASDPHGLRSHIKKLAYGAQSAKKTGYVKPKLTLSNNTVTFSLSSDGKYYVSNDITVSASYIKDYVNLALANSPSGSTIIDAKGNTVTKVKNGAKVRVKVPVSSVKNLQNSFYIKATATGKVQKSYLYKPSSGAYQSVTMSVLYAEESALKAQKSLSLKGTEVKITKVDSESGKALAGAKLQLKNASGTVVASWTTTTSAYVIKNLAAGKYTIVETAAPSGYKLSDVKQEVTVVAGSSVSAKFYNSKKEPTKVTIIKRDKATNQTLAGAKFVLKNAKGEVVTSWTSTTNGHYVKGLAEGTYTIEEVEAPAGYVKSTEVKTVKLESGKEVTVTFYNEKEQPTKVTVIKRDKETNQTLAGAKFVLKNAKGEVVTSWTSTTNGHYVKGLAEGTYTIEEVEAPAGYVKTDEVKTVNLEAGKDVVVTFYNSKVVEKNTIIKIVKINGETGSPLAGADLVLKDQNGNIIESWTSTTGAKIFNYLEVGTYYLSETKAPNGYTISDEVITIEVKNDGNTNEVVFRNIPKVKVPDTASGNNIITVIAGVILVAIGGSVLYINTKKEA